ncbi:MAG: glycosyltransferase family 39 protein [Flavobacteriales bacterium]|nr:MAG: glycosyltransferase family 39 protein [Flavobacteriales bacterium]
MARYHTLLLLAVWSLVLLVIDPRGDFPLNDDWAFAHDVKHLVEDGRSVFSDWPAMTLIAQTLWGAAFCKVFGFSHEVLRWAVVVLGIGCSLLMYQLAFLLANDRRRALFASLLLMLNPLFLALVVTYMTEVPFLFFTLLSLLSAQRWMARECKLHFVLACAIGMVAMFVRQHGIVLPLVFGCAFFLRGPKSLPRALAAIAPFVLAVVMLVLFGRWKATLVPAATQYAPLASLPAAVLESLDLGLVKRTGLSLFLIGLPLLPLAIGLGAASPRRWLVRPAPWAWVVLALATLCMIATWTRFPEGLVLYDLGLGAKLLKDTFWGEHFRGQLHPMALAMLRAVVCLGVLYIIGSVLRRSNDQLAPLPTARWFAIIITAIGGAWAGFTLLNTLFFDRYTLILAPLAILLIIAATKNRPVRWPVAWALLALLAIPYSLMLRDHFNWSRTRWAALDHLTGHMGVPPSHIDGGFEFNGWHRPGPRRKTVREGISWWFVADDAYVVASGPIQGFAPVDTFTYQRIIPWGTDTILVLQRHDLLRSNGSVGAGAEIQPSP